MTQSLSECGTSKEIGIMQSCRSQLDERVASRSQYHISEMLNVLVGNREHRNYQKSYKTPKMFPVKYDHRMNVLHSFVCIILLNCETSDY